jgi:hypothetical protein
MEIWKDVEGFVGYYQVSNLGNVRSLPRTSNTGKNLTGRTLRLLRTAKGYLRVVLYKNGTRTALSVHQVVATAFIPNPQNKPQVDHINCVKDDNRVENLRWVTQSENQLNPITSKRQSEVLKEKYASGYPFPAKHYSGAEHVKSRSIVRLGDPIKIYPTITSVKEDGFAPSNVSKVCRHIIPTSGGYRWMYEDEYLKSIHPN